jgi:glucosamine-6-phosphate isomerase
MKLLLADAYDALSSQAADDLVALLKDKKHPLICVASGDSPAGLYRELVRRVEAKELNVSDWYFVGLDEWLGMNGTDEGSCRFHLDQQLFHPLQINPERICFFDGRSKDAEAECQQVEAFIANHGGIDVAIVGLGLNGHVGMNEPGTPVSARTHVAELDPLTQQVGQKYFTQQTQLSAGLTLGIANLLECRAVFLMANGRHKAEIVQKVLNEPVAVVRPASLLLQHQAFSVYLDKEAASGIEKKVA